MDVDEILLDAESKMDDALSVLEQKLNLVRTGRANPALVENIEIEAYGDKVRLNQVAQIGIPEARLIVIKPFDPSIINNIEKGIQAANIGISPQNDGQFIRLSVPGLTEERRKQIANEVKKTGEQIKVSLRNIRRDANKEISSAEKNKALSEDASFSTKEEIQEMLKTYEKKTDDAVSKKVDEVTTV